MVASATTLRNTIQSNWALTGQLSKVVTGSGSSLMDEIVQFFDHLQVIGNQVTKAVVVTKISGEGNETIIRHPTFNEVVDYYDITLRFRIIDVDPVNYSSSLDLMEQMQTETVRILKTVYSPSSTTGEYFQTSNNWTDEDVDVGNQRDLRRKLRLSLTTITSDDDEVYTGYGGVLVFDTSASQGASKPASDYTYASVKNIDCNEGFSQIPTLTKDVSQGVGVPLYMRGMFSGFFSALMYAQKSNIIGTTVENLQQIYRLQTASALIGQVPEVALLRSNTNSETTTSTLTRQSFMKISNIKENTPTEDLVSYTITGTLTRPTIFSEST